ncbi:Androgen receptor [Varanus komodoensis]|nr:Androgen receptor [Varanus komodoensis]
MEVHVGLGRVYGRPAGKTFRGAFQSLFQSVCEAFHGSGDGGAREEAATAATPATAAGSAASTPCQSGARLQEPSPRRRLPLSPGSPSYLPLGGQSPASAGLQPAERDPHAAAASSSSAAAASSSLALLDSSFQSCPGDLKDILGEGSLLQAPAAESRGGAAAAVESPPDKEDFLGESAKELCKAVSASMGLAVEALDVPGGGGGDLAAARGDCMFALPGAHARAVTMGACKIVEAEHESGAAGGGGGGGEGALAMDVSGPLSLYKGSPELDEPSAAAFQSRDYYNFQLALASHGRIKLESPLEYAAPGGVWSAQCRRAAEVPALAPHYGGPPGPSWHPFFSEEGPIYAPCVPGEGAAAAPFGYGRSPGPAGQEGSDMPSEMWYPGGVVGRMPFAPAPGCIKTELTPWMEGYAGAYGDVR